MPPRICGKHLAFLATTLFVLILCFLCPPVVQAVAAPKTDAELGAALIGTWEIVFPKLRTKEFLLVNTDRTLKAILIANDRDSPRRVECNGSWRVSHGSFIQHFTKTTATHYVSVPLTLRDQIVSIENGIVISRDEKGQRSESRRISQLPDLPPLVTSATWTPHLTAAEAKDLYLSTPQPDYPTVARESRIEGNGLFRLVLTIDGRVDSIQVCKSTGSKILDDAAERALKQWRFKPGITLWVNVPISFVLGRQ